MDKIRRKRPRAVPPQVRRSCWRRVCNKDTKNEDASEETRLSIEVTHIILYISAQSDKMFFAGKTKGVSGLLPSALLVVME